ncbi:MAG: ribonuclease M5 [Streptococcaceae bacterium]|jgi:ribonuclease M5|nr:ribonuclease M5 [Streptococcaceae bacterium]
MREKRKIDKVLVVEGRDDTANLKRFYDVETYETRGSAINQEDIERLKVLQEKRGLIIFTDPDFQGERIRKIIMAQIPEAEHAFIQRSEGQPKSKSKGHSLGIEHADFEALELALALAGESRSKSEGFIELELADLQSFELVMGKESRRRREYLCRELRIGYTNGKQLLKRLNLFGISRDKIADTMKNYMNHE